MFYFMHISHKGSEAGVTFARHGYSWPDEASQPTGQSPRLIINRGRYCKVTATVNELLTVVGIVR
jgi:hypothetical protein